MSETDRRTIFINSHMNSVERNFSHRTRVSGPRLFSAGRDVIEDAFMRAYVAQRNADSELCEFVPKDALPNEVLSDLLREWSLPAMATVRAGLGDENVEAVREENHWCFVVWPENATIKPSRIVNKLIGWLRLW